MGLGLRALGDDLQISLKMNLYTGSAAARGTSHRKGPGKTRHLHVTHLWLQDKIGRGEMTLKKVGGKENVAALMTKHLGESDMQRHRAKLN